MERIIKEKEEVEHKYQTMKDEMSSNNMNNRDMSKTIDHQQAELTRLNAELAEVKKELKLKEADIYQFLITNTKVQQDGLEEMNKLRTEAR